MLRSAGRNKIVMKIANAINRSFGVMNIESEVRYCSLCAAKG